MINKKTEGVSQEMDNCCKRPEVPSEEEMVALNAMRSIKERVRDLKKRLSEVSSSHKEGDVQEALELEQKMDALKAQWNEWEEKRQRAARERMILLGHEELS
jgi:hypothetical protein